MIKVSLGKFTFTISIINLSCKYLMKRSLLLNLVWQKEILFHGCLKHFKIVCCQETVANNIEALCILLLKRLSYPCRLSHMVPLSGRNPTEIYDIKLHTRLYLQQI